MGPSLPMDVEQIHKHDLHVDISESTRCDQLSTRRTKRGGDSKYSIYGLNPTLGPMGTSSFRDSYGFELPLSHRFCPRCIKEWPPTPHLLTISRGIRAISDPVLYRLRVSCSITKRSSSPDVSRSTCLVVWPVELLRMEWKLWDQLRDQCSYEVKRLLDGL